MAIQLKGFRGVSCARCNGAIPVSARVISLHDEIAGGKRHVPHTFAVRCPTCEQESIYDIKGLQSFDGEPRKRKTRGRKA